MNLHAPKPPHPALTRRPGVELYGPFDDMTVDYLKRVEGPGGLRSPTLGEVGHIAYFGTTGSGKSTAMKLHMRSLLPPKQARDEHGMPTVQDFDINFRALVYDPKTDLIPFLSSLGFSLEQHVINTNIFDLRSVAWDVARDVDNYMAAKAFAEILAPPQSEKDPIWQNGVREIVHATLVGLIRHGKHWTMRDLTQVLTNPELLSVVLRRTPEGTRALERYLENEAQGFRGSMHASLATNSNPLLMAGEAWHRSTLSFSFKDWVAGGGILLLGDNYVAEKSAETVNNLLINYAIKAVLGQPGDIRHTTSLVYLDEIKRAGRFPNFGTLLTQGRSKGLHCVIAAQGYTTFRAAFDADHVGEVLNNCADKCIMQLTEPEDTDWAVRVFGNTKRMRVTHSVTLTGPGGRSNNYSPVEEQVITAREVSGLKSAQHNGRTLEAFVHGGGGAHDHVTVPGAQVRARLAPLPNAAREAAPFVERPGDDFTPTSLSLSELEHLGLVTATRAHASDTEGRNRGTRFRLPPPPGSHA